MKKYRDTIQISLCKKQEKNGCLIAISLVDGKMIIFGDYVIRLKISFDYFKDIKNTDGADHANTLIDLRKNSNRSCFSALNVHF